MGPEKRTPRKSGRQARTACRQWKRRLRSAFYSSGSGSAAGLRYRKDCMLTAAAVPFTALAVVLQLGCYRQDCVLMAEVASEERLLQL
ncbi:hypothetical protein NDU88_000225 [Pleurodeles waltl]|uniref:Uncharacterized protein n=1 Tax=Pleurodeles waltl TaxID=8319 RepID=A0AAV7P273_PLEWA|nr:hypothetical protein NDU88_000225 [Pleurodeles waltl]